MATLLLGTLNKARDLGRLHEIASVLVRHGLGDVVRRLGFARVVERAGAPGDARSDILGEVRHHVER